MHIASSIHSKACVSTAPRPLNHTAHNGTLKPDAFQSNERITVSLTKSLVERLRNAVYWTENHTMARVIARPSRKPSQSWNARMGRSSRRVSSPSDQDVDDVQALSPQTRRQIPLLAQCPSAV